MVHPTTGEELRWWNGQTVVCDGCDRQFPALDHTFKVATAQVDPCGWHTGFLDPLPKPG